MLALRHLSRRIRTLQRPSPRGATWLAAGMYAAVLSYASIDRHERFVTGGYDLGIFDQGIWLLGQARRPFSTVRGRDLLADHFQPAIVLLAPLGALEVTPAALLILQSVLLAAAAVPLYTLARQRGAHELLALTVALLWLASPLTQWANLFDYHPETAVPLLLAHAAVQVERGHHGRFLALATAASLLKEDVALVFLGWGLLLVLQGKRRFGTLLAGAALAWFLLATKVFLPLFGGNSDWYAARFAGHRGSSLGDMGLWLLEHPLQALRETATPTNAKLLLALILSSGGLALLAPALLLPIVPALTGNLFSAYVFQHQLQYHYQVIPALGFALASAYGAGALQRRRPAVVRSATVLLLAAVAVFAVAGPASEELRADAAPDRDARVRAVSLVPAHVPTAAAHNLVPHLAHRREIYQLPEPFFSRPDNGERWTAEELRERARKVEWVVHEVVGLDPVRRSQIRQLPLILRARGFTEVFNEDGVRVFRHPASTDDSDIPP